MIVPHDLVLASGARETVKVRINRDESWEGLTLSLTCRTVFLVGIVTRTVPALTPDTGVVIPGENLVPGALYLGVTGYGSDGVAKLTTGKLLAPIEIRSSEDDDHPAADTITPEMAETLLAAIGSLNQLLPESKENLVAAINELYRTSKSIKELVEKIPEDKSLSIKKLNGAPPDANGEFVLDADGIMAFPTNIPDFDGTVGDALDMLAAVSFNPLLVKWLTALIAYSDHDDTVVAPVLDTAGGNFGCMHVSGTMEEMEEGRSNFSIPTESKTIELINEILSKINLNGTSGGYYTPKIDQIDSTSIRLSFEASHEDMPAIDSATIILPKGDPGKDATVTAQKVKEVLGYTPFDASKVAQSGGDSTDKVMSQKAVTDLVKSAMGDKGDIYETVDSVSKMTDTSKSYILSTTGTIWQYGTKEVEVEAEKIEQIVGTSDNPYEVGRLSSGAANGTSGYVTTPYIDLTKYSTPFELHLEGGIFSHATHGSATQGNMRYSQYGTDKTHLKTDLNNSSSFNTYWSGAKLTDVGDGTIVISFTPPITNKSVAVGYARFSGQGTEGSVNVYIKYTGTSVSYIEAWVDTGVVVSDISEFSLSNSSVKNFMAQASYSDSDYSNTAVTGYCGSDYFRKDLPVPAILRWEQDLVSAEYAVAISTSSGASASSASIYYTKDSEIAIHNLIPGKTYYYKVHGLLVTGDKKLIKEGSFSTMPGTRMLSIDGIQNVRDVGGYTANGKKVKYGKIFRGSAMDEDVAKTLSITDAGKVEMLKRVGIKVDIDLRYGKTESPLGPGVTFANTSSGYDNYATAFTNATQKSNFKSLLETIVTNLSANAPVYIHCQGGCDRTGTLVFQLLGLLGVSESDLAKEYELSSFSQIGYTRTRSSDKYSGMVDALKTGYAGNTMAAKFEAFALDCGISEGIITTFRSLMLE